MFFLDALEEICSLAFSSFQRLSALLAPWFLPPSSNLFLLSASVVTSPLSLTLLPSLCDFTGLTWIIQDNLPISGELLSNLNSLGNLNSLLPCHLTYWQAQEIRMWASLWDYDSTYHRHQTLSWNHCSIVICS